MISSDNSVQNQPRYQTPQRSQQEKTIEVKLNVRYARQVGKRH